MTNNPIPLNGYKLNTLGHLVPVSKIKEIDLIRDELVLKIVEDVSAMQAQMRELKDHLIAEISAFLDISAAEYDVKLGSKKGNLTLKSFDGMYQVEMDNNRTIAFDEKIHAAKAIIDECVHRWLAEGGNDNVKALVEHSFKIDKKGNLDIRSVLSLMQLKIEDERWQVAMQAIKDAIITTGSKEYLRFYKREGEQNKYTQIHLNFSML